MSDLDFTDDDQQTDERTVTLKRDQIRALEDKAKGAGEATARAEAAERRLAFAEAGISLSDPKAKYFVNGYDGEVNVEAIKAAAIADGFLAAPEASGSEDQAALDRMAATAATSTPTVSNDQLAYEAAMAAANSPVEAMAVMAKFGRQTVTL